MPLENIAIPLALGTFVLFLVLLPLLRQRARTGRWAVVVRETSTSAESLVRWWTVGLLVAIAAWTVLLTTHGAVGLGVWEVPAVSAVIGCCLLVLGSLVVAIAQAQMGHSWRIGIDDEPTELVTTGLFRWVRHPIYSGILALLLGLTLITPSPWSVGGFAMGLLLVDLQARFEEEHMRGLHEEQFAAWASSVGRFVPLVGRLRGQGA